MDGTRKIITLKHRETREKIYVTETTSEERAGLGGLYSDTFYWTWRDDEFGPVIVQDNFMLLILQDGYVVKTS